MSIIQIGIILGFIVGLFCEWKRLKLFEILVFPWMPFASIILHGIGGGAIAFGLSYLF